MHYSQSDLFIFASSVLHIDLRCQIIPAAARIYLVSKKTRANVSVATLSLLKCKALTKSMPFDCWIGATPTYIQRISSESRANSDVRMRRSRHTESLRHELLSDQFIIILHQKRRLSIAISEDEFLTKRQNGHQKEWWLSRKRTVSPSLTGNISDCYFISGSIRVPSWCKKQWPVYKGKFTRLHNLACTSQSVHTTKP